MRKNDQRDDARGPENYRRGYRADVPAQSSGDNLARSEEDRAVNNPRRKVAFGDLFAQRRARPAAVLLEDHAGHRHRNDAAYAVRSDARDVGPERMARPRQNWNDHLNHAKQESAQRDRGGLVVAFDQRLG